MIIIALVAEFLWSQLTYYNAPLYLLADCGGVITLGRDESRTIVSSQRSAKCYWLVTASPGYLIGRFKF